MKTREAIVPQGGDPIPPTIPSVMGTGPRRPRLLGNFMFVSGEGERTVLDHCENHGLRPISLWWGPDGFVRALCEIEATS